MENSEALSLNVKSPFGSVSVSSPSIKEAGM